MMSLAVTGGIGSGKSFITRMFSVMGYPVYDADSRTKRLYAESARLRAALGELLGEGVFHGDVLDRRTMAEMVFADASLLSRVEAVVYPALLSDMKGWLEQCRRAGVGMAVVESALILEKNIFLTAIDKVLTVSAPEELRTVRAMSRDGSDREQVLRRMKCQNTDGWREERAGFVIRNDGRPLLPQLMAVLDELNPDKNQSDGLR